MANVLQSLFNSVFLEGTRPEAKNKRVVVLFFRKGDYTLLTTDRLANEPCLLAVLILNRLERRLDDFMPLGHTGFRKGYYSTVDRIHTLGQVIQKTGEYNL